MNLFSRIYFLYIQYFAESLIDNFIFLFNTRREIEKYFFAYTWKSIVDNKNKK